MASLVLILVPTSLLGLIAIMLCLPRVAMAQETASSVTRVTTGAAYAGATAPALMGLSTDEWQAIGVIGGLILGVLTLVGNVLVTWHFKRKHLELARAKAGIPVSDGGDDE